MAFRSFPKPVKAVKKPNRTVSKARAAKRRKSEAVKRDVYALVDARDQGRCRVCGWATPLMHHHHMVYRSQGGKHTTSNVVTLCAVCHTSEHLHHLTIRGDADQTLDIKNGPNTWRSPCPT